MVGKLDGNLEEAYEKISVYKHDGSIGVVPSELFSSFDSASGPLGMPPFGEDLVDGVAGLFSEMRELEFTARRNK